MVGIWGSSSLEQSHAVDPPEEYLVHRVKGHCEVNTQALAVGRNRHGKLSLAPHESWAHRSPSPAEMGCW